MTTATERIVKKADLFEGELRELSYDAYCIFEDMKEDGNFDAGTRAMWQHVSHLLQRVVVECFGGYGTPDSD